MSAVMATMYEPVHAFVMTAVCQSESCSVTEQEVIQLGLKQATARRALGELSRDQLLDERTEKPESGGRHKLRWCLDPNKFCAVVRHRSSHIIADGAEHTALMDIHDDATRLCELS